ncbi:FecR family protein [Flavobacteriaceae bacterium S356]|uniref:FecR family protein n=1 Tax=Asprobacillus argus TaxID=3076534 RepID=A0ABU3LDW0_9FLAO|nr:FecR family protein [Flavobacteriaceae bacterium S356]
MKRSQSDTFLARWLNNELTPKELSEFEKSSDYLLYKKIAERSLEFSAPDYNKEQIFSQIEKKVSSKKERKVITLVKRLSYVAAASVVLTIGILLFNNESEHITDIGEKLAVVLPDNSKVLLNSKTTISYNDSQWGEKRIVKLDGEAYFEVEKGSTFIVESPHGQVAVLGTKFNIRTDEGFFEVICYEGKVEARTREHSGILTQGNAFRKQQGIVPERWDVTHNEPTWKTGESSFKSVPLKHVIKALEGQYNVAFDLSNINSEDKFTGSFTHDNLKTALQTVFVPMKIGVTFSGKKTVVLEAMNE